MKQQIKVPSAGESVTQATIGEWQKKDGDYVQQNDVLVVMETDKASMDLVAEHGGLLKIFKLDGEDVAIGEVIGELDISAKPPKDTTTVTSPTSSQPDKQEHKEEKKESPTDKKTAPSAEHPTTIPSLTNPSLTSSKTQLTAGLGPAVKKLIAEQSLDPSQIPATGPKGRVTKGDVLDFIKHPKQKPDSGTLELPAGFEQRTKTEQVRERMSTLRRRVAERLVESQQSTATLTTFNEIDMSKVIALRVEYKEAFQKKYNVKLGFMGFFIKAVINALEAFPKVNAFIEDREIVYNQGYHIGVAVSTEKGLVVPVIKNAEQLSLADVEKAVLFYAVKARDGKISPDDLMGGTFTISNGGVFGSLMSTPILNPPQSGILGMHKIEQRPVAVDGQLKVKPMMYVALSYDHRMVDGRESVGFLVKIKECVEDPFRLLIDI